MNTKVWMWITVAALGGTAVWMLGCATNAPRPAESRLADAQDPAPRADEAEADDPDVGGVVCGGQFFLEYDADEPTDSSSNS